MGRRREEEGKGVAAPRLPIAAVSSAAVELAATVAMETATIISEAASSIRLGREKTVNNQRRRRMLGGGCSLSHRRRRMLHCCRRNHEPR
ncbi:hypothetical protein AHAS_Ahas13G0285200 [Arachis hypogaea]